MRNNRIVIPSFLHEDMLDRLHTGPQGITKCYRRALQSVWWPGLNSHLERLVTNCTENCRHRVQHPEPLLLTTFPNLPWQKVTSDLFVWKNFQSLFTFQDTYIEIAKLNSESTGLSSSM